MQETQVQTQKATGKNPLLQLEALGQSIWLDYTRRDLIRSGRLRRLIEEDGLSGVTSNPSIFDNAIGGTDEYDDTVRALAREGKEGPALFEALAVGELQQVADLLRPVYNRTEGRDGFVSMEVSPKLAHDTDGTINEARRLWRALDRPNAMIKVPATAEGIPAIRQLIGSGINVNITLLFGLPRYREVIFAYLEGLEERVRKDQAINRMASVASFFLSRIDVLVDPQLEKVIEAGGPRADMARSLLGQTAIASAKVAYQIYSQEFGGTRFRALLERGARTQRLLWASTSTKNPAYSDIKYVAALIGPDTIDTLPLETLDAFRDHGVAQPLLETDVLAAHQSLDNLAKLGIDLDQVTQQLEDEGVEKFSDAFDHLMRTLRTKRDAALAK